MKDQTFTLSDGRTLGFRFLGDADGCPLFFFHGTPGSRFVLTQDDLLAKTPGLRLILPDRPGYGLSDPQPGRTLLDWPDDVAELADRLGLESFAVAGGSGGGPHALACAYRLPRRVTTALVYSSPSSAGFKGATRGMAVRNRLAIWLSRYAPGLMRRMTLSYVARTRENPERFLDLVVQEVGPSDRALLQDETVRKAILEENQEAYRQGGEGHADDGALAMTSASWGFDLREISVPVFLWHGEEDKLVSRHMAEHLAREIPGCQARIVPGAGHLLIEDQSVVEEMRKALGVESSVPFDPSSPS